MAASFLHKLLKKPLPSPPLRILTSFNKSQLPNPPTSPFLRQNPDPNPGPDANRDANLLPVFPSFPHCFSLQPIYLRGFDRSDSEMGSGAGDGSGGDGTMIWADSVKKKRKRKMNKHKLKKLRKRLRRKA